MTVQATEPAPTSRLLSVEDARNMVLATIDGPLPSETVALGAALGRVVA
jgi:molybdopterin biosynthesis enzyme